MRRTFAMLGLAFVLSVAIGAIAGAPKQTDE